MFLGKGSRGQEGERRLRDSLATERLQSAVDVLLQEVAANHCIPVMRRKAEEFLATVGPSGWILDVGIGYGWHWVGQRQGAKIVGIDMSLGNLQLARRVLGPAGSGVVLICADAAALPVRDRTISGVWSVQTFQHFPEDVLQSVFLELERVSRDEFLFEVANANPAWLHRLIYRLCGKRLHCRGPIGAMELNRFSAREWTALWRRFRNGNTQIVCAYSELFFHPDLHLRPRRYPLGLERAIATRLPALAALFARQLHLRVEPRALS